MREQPSRAILDAFQKSGVPWQAVEREAVYTTCEALAKAGVEFPEGTALMDLHYWINLQKVKPYRYYAARWKWKADRTYKLFVAVGIYGKDVETDSKQAASKNKQNASNEQAKGAENDNENDDFQAASKQTQADSKQAASSIKDPKILDPEKDKRESAEDRRARARPADLAEVIAYFRQRQAPNPEHLAEAWWDCFEGRGWKVGKARTPMVDWRATVRTWIRNEPNFSNGNGNGSHTQHPSGTAEGRPPGKPGTAFQRHQSLTVEQARWDREQRLARKRNGTSVNPGVPDDPGRDTDLAGRVPVEDRRGAAG